LKILLNYRDLKATINSPASLLFIIFYIFSEALSHNVWQKLFIAVANSILYPDS
jgi:predicted Na+-dependent transporter